MMPKFQSEKEMIKNIMLEHEATFKHQVSELHRVYGRQRELMDEIKMKELTTDKIEGKTSNSNPIMFGGLSESNQTCQVPNFTLVDPSCHWPSSALNFQVSSTFDAGKSMQAATNTSIIASSLKDNVLLPSSSKEFRKRTFDLELPADEYIDHEEERFEGGTVSGVSKAPDYAIKDLSAVCHQKDIKLSICKDQLNHSEGNSSGSKYQIDLNSSPKEDESAQVEVETKSAADINLEPPVSPENKESSPPRGNSVEKHPTESVELTEKDDKCQKDLVLLAAEGLVIISSNSAQCLKWFAGIVSSAEEDETVQGRVADSDHSELVADGLNNFAALTPQMEETKFEEYCFNSTGNKKRIAPATSSSLPKRKRTRRTKSQKAMQGDILPRITSPSRQEVSQETHTISGLRENEGKARFGKKKLSKNKRRKGKKHDSKSTVLQHLMCSYPKQQTDDAKLDSLERCPPSWGRRNKRQTGRRRPAPNHALGLAVLRLEG